MVISYTQKFTDKTYNPLPRDVVVRNNRLGRNGFDPKFKGGPEVAKALGGALPSVIWDGITGYAGIAETVHVRLSGPVLNLRLPAPGAVDQANPTVAPEIGDANPVEPKAVVLPTRQANLGG